MRLWSISWHMPLDQLHDCSRLISTVIDWFDWDISWTNLMHEQGAKLSNRIRAMVEDMRDPQSRQWTPPEEDG